MKPIDETNDKFSNEPDSYYGESDEGNDEIDLSFLDDESTNKLK